MLSDTAQTLHNVQTLLGYPFSRTLGPGALKPLEQSVKVTVLPAPKLV
jgi:hypothetical protein